MLLNINVQFNIQIADTTAYITAKADKGTPAEADDLLAISLLHHLLSDGAKINKTCTRRTKKIGERVVDKLVIDMETPFSFNTLPEQSK